MAAVVACLDSDLGMSASVNGVVGMWCFIGMGLVMSTRRGRSSNRDTTKRLWLCGWSSAGVDWGGEFDQSNSFLCLEVPEDGPPVLGGC